MQIKMKKKLSGLPLVRDWHTRNKQRKKARKKKERTKARKKKERKKSWWEWYSLLHVEWHSIKSCNLKFVSPMSQFVSPMSQFESQMVQPIACGVAFSLNLQSQSHSSLFNGTWQKRPRDLDYWLRFEIEERTLQIQQAVNANSN